MPKSTRKSAAHRRTRNDHATETAEDYVEAVAEILAHQPHCRIKDLQDRFAVSHVTVNRIVARLQREGLLATEPYAPILLTARGKRLAAKCRERHEIVFQFLRLVGVDDVTADIDAEGIEHHVSPATLNRFRELVDTGRIGP
jgi:DtxR family manganese transport transcriptional regulator